MNTLVSRSATAVRLFDGLKRFHRLMMGRRYFWASLFLLGAAAAAPAQSQGINVVHTFQNSDGSDPLGIILGNDGNYYGVTSAGGAQTNCPVLGGCGTLFRVTPSGVFSEVVDFVSENGYVYQPAAITASAPGHLAFVAFGQCGFQSPTLLGTCVQELNTNGSKYSEMDFEFPLSNPQAVNNSVCGPAMTLTSSNGVIGTDCGATYETTLNGSPISVPPFAWTAFQSGSSPSITVANAYPGAGAPLVLGNDGNYYGTSGAEGEIFKMTPAGAVTILYTFSGTANGFNLSSQSLTLGRDGNFYGATSGCNPGCTDAQGEANTRNGTIFKMTPAGTLTTLYIFPFGSSTQQGTPSSSLVQAPSGNFYGTTFYGGAYSCGSVFQITPSGNFTQLK